MFAFTSSNGGVWWLCVRSGRVRVSLPLALFVLDDLLASAEDLCGLILPRLGAPNYAALLRALLAGLCAGQDCPLLEIHAHGARILFTPDRRKGRD